MSDAMSDEQLERVRGRVAYETGDAYYDDADVVLHDRRTLLAEVDRLRARVADVVASHDRDVRAAYDDGEREGRAEASAELERSRPVMALLERHMACVSNCDGRYAAGRGVSRLSYGTTPGEACAAALAALDADGARKGGRDA